MTITKFKHPKAFYVIFMLEIWERFGYSSVISILAVFFVKELGLSEINSFVLFGSYSALIYSFISLGGYIGDKILGAKRTIILGLLTLLSGYLLLGLGTINTVYFAMSLVCIGTGLFKSNPSSLLAKCYDKDQPELIHNAFTLFYMAINIGSVLGMFLSPVISAKFGFSYSFLSSAIGIFLALFSFSFSRVGLKHISTEAGANPINFAALSIVIVGIIISTFIVSFLLKNIIFAQIVLWGMAAFVISWYLSITIKQSGKTKTRMLLAVILMFEAIIFQILYGQMQTSLNFFAINNVTHTLLGFNIQPQSFQSLNPFWIVVISPFLSYFYIKIKQNGVNFSIYNKFATGMLLCALAFLVLFIAKYSADANFIVSSWWLVLSYFLQSAGELMISALGVAMVAELVPASISGFVMGMWFVFLSIGNLLSGYVASMMALPEGKIIKSQSLSIYCDSFLKIGLFALVVAIIMFMASKYKRKMI
ncbi:MAG: oligopeptide:H+ symporter [Proteobacteria bacterium]|nr:oligopeptide:H+ symporter [Pseudomonadota bacterium]